MRSGNRRRDAGRQKGVYRLHGRHPREAQSWRELLLDLKQRGLSIAPELAVADGALGFWKALAEVWPKTRE
jgi:hypothetical protein